MRSLRKIRVSRGMPILVRAALNAPMKQGTVTEDFRLSRALPTIEYLRAKGARVILAGHVSGSGTETLRPVYEAMKPWLPALSFCPVPVGKEARQMVRLLRPGDVLMLENLRRDRGEERNDPAFAKGLAELADAFVQDSFDVCHRAHASVTGVPEFLPSYAGLLLAEEVRSLRKAAKPKRPALAIVGGAKFATKQPVLAQLMRAYDRVFVGGALANDFMQAKGLPVGRSLISCPDQDALRALMKDTKLLLPLDYVVAPAGRSRTEGRIASLEDVRADEAILDNGPKTIAMLASYAARAQTILWNGPLGAYEDGFVEGTEALARVIADTDAHSIVGGGDTVAAIDALRLNERFSFVSTGGGAMLDFLAKGTLPGLEALR